MAIDFWIGFGLGALVFPAILLARWSATKIERLRDIIPRG